MGDSKPLSSGKGAAEGTSTGWTNPAWAGVTGQGTTYKKATLPSLKPDKNYVNPAWAGYIEAAKKGKSYQQVHADAKPTYGSGAYIQAYLDRETQTKPSPKKVVTGSSDGSLVIFESPAKMKFNLPPHQWSLPVNPSSLNTSVYSDKVQINHSNRRAIMWYYGGADTTDSAVLLGANPVTATASQTTYTTTPQDNFWGFQFLWNPEAFQNVLTRNSNVVPSNLDAHAALNGLFTAMESIQFKIVIDRINDFACLKALASKYTEGYAPTETFKIGKNVLSEIAAKYYTNGYPSNPDVKEDPADQLSDLLTMGTMADIEYIYKMINGSGQNGKNWTNGLGRKTSDLAFLSPTAIGLRLGPNPDSLSYVGWVESLNVNHMMFTEDMIPIHSEISVMFNGFSRVGLTSKN